MKNLIISHNPICTYNNMGKTFMSLFSVFDKEELCQLYIYPSLPDCEFCSSYYRVTDKDVLKSYYKFKVRGREVQKEEISTERHELFENANDEKLYRNRKNKKPSRLLLRDLMWKFSRWYNKSLRNWIKEQQPTCIFVAPGTGKFLYDMALKISKKYNLPIVSYICDDYYFVKKADSFLGRIQQRFLKKKIEKLLTLSKNIVTICDELKDCYEQKFGVPTQTIMTGSSFPIAENVKEQAQVKTITYMGNIRCNRYTALAKVGQALDEINAENGTDFSLEIYTSEKDEGILNSFEGINSLKLCGFISGKEFEKKLQNAELLLHVEAFDEKSIDLVKHSVSTKIADSLGSGVCLLGYGPKEVASMQHLIKNDCALVCTAESELKGFLWKAFFDVEERKRVVENALKAARLYHDGFVTSRRLYEMMNTLLK